MIFAHGHHHNAKFSGVDQCDQLNPEHKPGDAPGPVPAVGACSLHVAPVRQRK